MAQSRPKELPEEIRKEPFRSAEILVFEALKNLPDSFHVLYGVNWYIKRQNDIWTEGETDFVVLSPKIGIVVIEVKGGQIGRDLESWYSIDRNGVKHKIKDPVKQASFGKHNLLQYLNKQSLFCHRKLPARHMVCFPNVYAKDARTLIELPREMQILADDLHHIQNKIEEFAQYDYDKIYQCLSNQDCTTIANILKPNFNYPTRWSLQVERQNQIIDSLTSEQAEIWNLIGANQHMALSGPAGSGKTILAIKLAKQYITNDKNVLVLVPSRNLREYYEQSLDNKVDSKNYFMPCFTKNKISSIKSLKKYDLIIIDEAQDLDDKTWFNIYNIFDIHKCRCLLVIFDSNQKLKNKCKGNPFEKLVPLQLSKVVRNTKQIATFVTQFYDNKIPIKPIGPDGLKVEFSACKPEDTLKVIMKLINQYVIKDNFNYSDIVVLFGQNKRHKIVMENEIDNEHGITLRLLHSMEGATYKNPFVIADTIYSYRGLESKIVILCNIDNEDMNNLKNECYVGASRAKNILHIVADEDTLKQISFD